MKKFSALVATALMFVACQEQNTSSDFNTTITASIDGIEDSTQIYLFGYVDEKMDKLDSLYTVDGQFSFSFDLNAAEVVRVKIGTARSFEVFAEAGDLNLNGHVDSLSEIEISGSSSHNLFMEFQDTYEGFNNQMRDLYPQYTIAEEAGDTIEMDRIDSTYEAIYEGQNTYLMNFIKSNGDSPVGAYLAYRYLYNTPLDELKEIYASYTEEVKDGDYGTMMANRIGILSKVAIGKPAVNIALEDPEGNIKSIEDFKGSYLLVDFWASWCGPCRAENPNVVRMYNEYHDKGFDILGVSFDQDRDRWLGAIEDDSLTWTHISDLKGWDCAGGKLYGVRSIPHTVLIDPDGVIIAKDLRGEELEAKLAEFLTEI